VTILSKADTQYLDIIAHILDHGFYANNRTGIPTYKLPHQIMQFDLEEEFPILTTKFVAFKTAVKEILWIWQLQSNDVRELQKMNCHVWDEWMRPDGTIGKAYGYQIRKFKQVDKLLDQLINDPQNRRMIVSLWNIEDLPDMALQPCAFQTLWDVTDGRLNCMLIQRSGDMGLGVPFNMTQYAVLIHLIAQTVGLRPGLFTHVINNAHIYENHIPAMKTQLARRSQALAAPKLLINPAVHDFYQFKPEDIQLDEYKHLGKLSMEVAV
jgi:thymidylate synthase